MPNGSTLLTMFLKNSKILSKDRARYYGTEMEGCRCLNLLIDSGADPNTRIDSQPLLDYCLEKGMVQENGSSEEFILHLIQKADISTAGSNGNFPLHQALTKEGEVIGHSSPLAQLSRHWLPEGPI